MTVVLRDSGSIELGKQILQLNGGPLPARGAQLDLLVQLWKAVNDWLTATARALAPEPEGSGSWRKGSLAALAPDSAAVEPADRGQGLGRMGELGI